MTQLQNNGGYQVLVGRTSARNLSHESRSKERIASQRLENQIYQSILSSTALIYSQDKQKEEKPIETEFLLSPKVDNPNIYINKPGISTTIFQT